MAFPVAGSLKVRFSKRVAQVAPAVKRQVHDKKSHVGDRVGVAKSLVELDAVDNDEIIRRLAIRKEIDMVQVEVAVSIFRHTAARSFLNQGEKRSKGLLGQRSQPREHGRADRDPYM